MVQAPLGVLSPAANLRVGSMPVQVLICDDQEAFRAAAREVVNATQGFEVVGETETGEASVVAAGQLHPDMVLMDVHLPGIDGLEASRRIRAAYPKVAVLLLSTYDREEFANRIAESGAIAFMPKAAFGPEGLMEMWARAALVD
jgi:DNA-binding NarL/FixJ family response regulator